MELDHDITKLARANEMTSSGVFPLFHHETRKDEEASLEAGAAVYKRVPYVEIISPGNDKEKMNRAVKEEDKQRWPEQWKNFVEGREEPDFDGMPISEWTMSDVHLERTLRESNIFTVEQLAEVADVNIQMLGMGMMALKNKAREWVKNKSGQSEELENAKKQIAELIEAVEKLQAVSVETKVVVEPVIKSGGWYTYKGKKCRESELPPEVLEAFKETEG